MSADHRTFLSGRRVILLTEARRFWCDMVVCGRRIFCEQFNKGVLTRHSRRTQRHAADLLRYRHHCRSSGPVILHLIESHPHRALADFRRKPVRGLARHGSTLSGVAASGKLGADRSSNQQIVHTMRTGTVKYVWPDGNWAFISRDDKRPKVFLHISEVQQARFYEVVKGQR